MKQMTPRTDENAFLADNWNKVVSVSFSKQLETELNTLQQWKDEQLAVEATWGAQEVGKELGLALGSPIRPQILPAIKILKAALEREQQDCAALRQMVRELLDALSHKCKLTGGTLATHELISKANQLLP